MSSGPPRFGPSNPADNIHVLLQHLEKERSGRHFFRGQNRWFAHNAPSAIRPAMDATRATDRWVPTTPNYADSATLREQARQDLRIALMQFWGPAVGNLLSQQYGVTSDGFDITADPRIAAFFATRKYPTYRQLLPAEAVSPGVIYRFTIESPPGLDLEMVNFTLGSYGYLDKGKGGWVYFSQPVNPNGVIRYAARRGITLSMDGLVKDLKAPVCRRELMKVEACLRHDAIEALFLENTKARGIAMDAAVYGATRTAHQAGGVYFPSFRHEAIVSCEPESQRLDGMRFLANPPLAIFERTTHVQELHSFHTIEPFFFRHDPGSSVDGFSLPRLWPDGTQDPVYAAICGIAEKECGFYLDSVKVPANDLALGVVDPGYEV